MQHMRPITLHIWPVCWDSGRKIGFDVSGEYERCIRWSKECLKYTPQWCQIGPWGGQNEPRRDQNGAEIAPRGVQTGPGAPKMVMRRPRWDPKQELRPLKCNPRAARCAPKGREPVLGRWGAQKGPKRRQIWDLKRDKMGTRFLEHFGALSWSHSPFALAILAPFWEPKWSPEASFLELLCNTLGLYFPPIRRPSNAVRAT